jgi:DnaJ-class molecular chaperone
MTMAEPCEKCDRLDANTCPTCNPLGEPSACPFCNGKAEMHEWEERDAVRWVAQVKCTSCGGAGPIGYANNRLGCFDAVNDLHKKRALAAWNRRDYAGREE